MILPERCSTREPPTNVSYLPPVLQFSLSIPSSSLHLTLRPCRFSLESIGWRCTMVPSANSTGLNIYWERHGRWDGPPGAHAPARRSSQIQMDRGTTMNMRHCRRSSPSKCPVSWLQILPTLTFRSDGPHISFTTAAGYSYQIEFKDNLSRSFVGAASRCRIDRRDWKHRRNYRPQCQRPETPLLSCKIALVDGDRPEFHREKQFRHSWKDYLVLKLEFRY